MDFGGVKPSGRVAGRAWPEVCELRRSSKTLTSTSQESLSVVTVEFISGTDIDDALQKVRDRVSRAEADLPLDAEDPQIEEISFSDIPVLQVHLSGSVGPVVLKRLAEDLQDRLESLPGVLRANPPG